ncbi:two pore channel protein 2-like [Corticium candelabrum]|uniref:two pore channel protein 2-like n=1 Tax=Corticium candelabrum TaxID=121492 RepID=UPI002E27320D|nr:two pore channel protein 2-like [Corticium candelabrum]XP_062515803.1 two pore channel protein 2-like [Corticium candelabrum]
MSNNLFEDRDRRPLVTWRRDRRSVVHEDESSSLLLEQAVVFVKDAIKYRSIHHKIDRIALKVYQVYYSRPAQWFLRFTIFTILILAFFERPTSLSKSSDPARAAGHRLEAPCGVMEAIEFVCLFIFLIDVITKIYLLGLKRSTRRPWVVVYLVLVIVSMSDWGATVGMSCREIAHVTKWRRLFRPFFLLQYSSLLKKTLKSINKTLPGIVGVLFLLALHLYFFTVLGMLLFTRKVTQPMKNITGSNVLLEAHLAKRHDVTLLTESEKYFSSLGTAFISLLVLLTTANNPDVMLPAYRENRLYALYFIAFLSIGLYIFLNLLTAVIYNQFRGYLSTSMQASFFRRRVGIRAAFEVMKHHSANRSISTSGEVVNITLVKSLIDRVMIPSKHRPFMHQHLDIWSTDVMTCEQFKDFFDILYQDSSTFAPSPDRFTYSLHTIIRFLQKLVLHKWFCYFQILVSVTNCIVLTVDISTEYDSSLSRDDHLALVNMSFIFYYVIEQVFILLVIGFQEYTRHKGNVFNGLVTLALMALQIAIFCYDPYPFQKTEDRVVTSRTLWALYRVVSIVILLRVLQIVPHIKTFSLITSTLLELGKSLVPFIGILVVVYYFFAILGMQIFADIDVRLSDINRTNAEQYNKCGSYEQLGYYPNNFNDFAAALVVLWDVMVVNNWFVFLEAYKRAVSPWSQLYFIAWWLVSAVLCVNIFIALVLEAFISQWEESKNTGERDVTGARVRWLESDSIPAVASSELRRPSTVDRRISVDVTDAVVVHQIFRDKLVEPGEAEIMHELHRHENLVI